MSCSRAKFTFTFVINVKVTSRKVPVIRADFNKLEISRQIFEKEAQILNFIKIRPVGAELFHLERRTDRRTDMTKLIVAFRNFVNAPNNRRSV